jgi:amino acid transporter
MSPASLGALMMRRKAIDTSPSQLARKLGVVDLTFLGVGATLGAGVYVLTGVIAKSAGPGVIVSFLVSGFAAILSALCYAEFGARVPRAGSAYVYSYVTMGEALAFTTGWQLLLEYIIGASSVARSWSGYLDTLAGGSISAAMGRALPAMHVPGLAADPDFIAFGMTMLLACVCAIGVRESTMVNNLLTALNIGVILFVLSVGSAYVSEPNFTPFAPTGFTGMFSGASMAAYAYVGFDVIATSAEEAINPQRNIPLAIIGSLVLCACCYVGVSAVIVGMVPYATIDTAAPLAAAFAAHGAQWAKYIISVGAVCGLSTSLMTCIFPMPRIVYAIAQDGLLPAWLAAVHPRFNTPVLATLLCGFLAATMALIFDIVALADMMSIGTLISYTLVAVSILVLRFRDSELPEEGAAGGDGGVGGRRGRTSSIETPLTAAAGGARGARAASGAPPARRFSPFGDAFRVMSDGSMCVGGAPVSKNRACVVALAWFLSGTAAACACAAGISIAGLTGTVLWAVVGVAALGGLLGLGGAVAICMIPSTRPPEVAFLTPLFPYVPLVSIAVNLYLLANLSYLTWIRFVVWCVIGSAIYLGYGIKHSTAVVEEISGGIKYTRSAGGAGAGEEAAAAADSDGVGEAAAFLLRGVATGPKRAAAAAR